MSSRREWVRVEARNLMTRLQVASVEVRNLMMGSFIRSLNEDKNELIVVPQGRGSDYDSIAKLYVLGYEDKSIVCDF